LDGIAWRLLWRLPGIDAWCHLTFNALSVRLGRVEVRITPEAQSQFDALPLTIKVRVLRVFERLGRWPEVSGAKPLRGARRGERRIRTGDYRVIFRPVAQTVLVVGIGHRKDVYGDS
jgi:mRNA interferase RelE/StbE